VAAAHAAPFRIGGVTVVRLLLLVVAVWCGAVAVARAQGETEPSVRLLLLPLEVKAESDSATSVAVMDAARERLSGLVHGRAFVVPKAKLCDALRASAFACDVLLDRTQAGLLAKFLNVQAYSTGQLETGPGTLVAHVRIVDLGGSGLAVMFDATGATPPALGDAIAQRLNGIARAGESARACTEKRQRGDWTGALDAAHKALALEPDLTAAHLCVESVYEGQRQPAESLLAASLRATRGDSLNSVAWETIARLYQERGDTLKAIDAFARELVGDPQNLQLRLGVADLMRQQRQYQRAVGVINEGLVANQGDPHLLALKSQVCIEGQLWRCTLDGFQAQAAADSTRLADSSFLKAAIGASQQLQDTTALLFFAHAATKAFPKSLDFWKVLGSAYDLKGVRDSAVWAGRQALALNPDDPNAGLLLAKAVIEGAAYDTAAANRAKSDTAALHTMRIAFAAKLDSGRAALAPALSAGDSTQRLSASVLLLTGGSKLAQAGAYGPAYDWLTQTLATVRPQSPADTTGPRQQVRVQASFWFGLASVASLAGPYQDMIKTKSCEDAKALNDRIARTKEALTLGTPLQPTFVATMLQALAKFEAVMPKVKTQFACKNF